MTEAKTILAYEFGPFRLELAESRLLQEGKPVSLRAKVFDTLRVLVENQGRLVEKETLINAVWPDALVEENNLAHNISALRRLLGQSADGKEYIETVPKRGYRFAEELTEIREETPPPPPHGMDQEIRFCTARDGVRLAYATIGEGPPLIKAANWLNHLEFDLHSPIWQPLFTEFAHDHTLIRFDQRGSGLSDREVDDISPEAFVSDLEAVAESAGPERFALFGISQGCASCIEYTARNPDRVTHLILHGGYAKGWRKRGSPEEIERREALSTLIKHGWGEENPAFHQVFSSLYMPDTTPEQAQAWIDLQRITTSPETAVRIWNANGDIDVRPLLPEINAPTLVLHSRNDAAMPFEEGREMAASIPGAKLVALESRNHLILEQEPAWPRFISEIKNFLKT